MPIIEITLIEGRDSAEVEQCIKNVASTVSETLSVPLDRVRVMVREYPANRFAVGTQLKSEASA